MWSNDVSRLATIKNQDVIMRDWTYEDHYCHRAYTDSPQPIGFNATISAPHMHAYCLEMFGDLLRPGIRVIKPQKLQGKFQCNFHPCNQMNRKLEGNLIKDRIGWVGVK